MSSIAKIVSTILCIIPMVTFAQQGADKIAQKYFTKSGINIEQYRSFQTELRKYFSTSKNLINKALSDGPDSFYLKNIVADMIPTKVPMASSLHFCWSILEESVRMIENKKINDAKKQFRLWKQCANESLYFKLQKKLGLQQKTKIGSLN